MRHYVYTLAYPDGRVFYVGKGTGGRIDTHEQEARSGAGSWKCNIIRAIWAQGGEVVKTKVGYFASNEEALRYEHYLISTMPSLANVVHGEGRFGAVAISPVDQKVFGASIRRLDEQGLEYWSAREVSNFLGYVNWSVFCALIGRVERNQARVGFDIAAHFRHMRRYIVVGNGAVREIDDIRLTRIAFLLVLSSADPHKGIVAYGKVYIAQTTLRVTHPQALLRHFTEEVTILAPCLTKSFGHWKAPKTCPHHPTAFSRSSGWSAKRRPASSRRSSATLRARASQTPENEE